MTRGITESAPSRDLDAIFILSALGIGGSERKIARIATKMAGDGAKVAVCALGPPYTLASALPAGVKVYTLNRSRRVSPRVMRQLAKIITKTQPRTVFAVDLFALLYSRVALRMAASRHISVVALINTTTFVRWRDRAFMAIYTPLLRGTDLLIFGSLRQREEWRRRYRLGTTRSVVIHNGVDTSHFSGAGGVLREPCRQQLGIDTKAVVIGAVGRVAPEKNHLALLRALHVLVREGADVRMLIVGDGPLRAALRTEASRLGLSERLIMPGETKDVRPMLAAMDIYALPSTAVETFSNATLEAMAMSLPVVLSDIGGAREMVISDDHGLIVPPGDDAGLQDALGRLCRDPQLRAQMGRAARHRVESEFDFETMVKAYSAIAASSLSGAG